MGEQTGADGRFTTPYAAIEAFARNGLSADELVELLGHWHYASAPKRRDDAGVVSEAPEYTRGTVHDIVEAAGRGLIDMDLYERIYDRICELQGE